MNKLKHITNWIVWSLMGLYAVLMIAVQQPHVQRFMGKMVAEALQAKLGTKVEVGRINLGFFNRIIIDDVMIYDQQQQKMLQANRLTARPELLPLTKGKIAISSAQIFGVKANLYKPSASEPTNFQFVVDSLASKDTTHHTPLDLNINSFIIRHSSVRYDQNDIATTPGRFNAHHINVHDISAHIILKTLTDDSLNIKVKRLALKEKSGLDIQSIAFLLSANKNTARLGNFELSLPQSSISIDSIKATFNTDRLKETLKFGISGFNASITPSDIAFLMPQLNNYDNAISIKAKAKGTANDFSFNDIRIASDDKDIKLLANGSLHLANTKPTWTANITDLTIGKKTFEYIDRNISKLPEPLLRAGTILWKGTLGYDAEGTYSADGDIATDVGAAKATLLWSEDNLFSGIIKTDGINIKELLENSRIGTVAANIKAAGKISNKKLNTLTVSGTIPVVGFDGKEYHNIALDAEYNDNTAKGWVNIDDSRLRTHIEADVKATSLNDAVGTVSITDLWLPEKDFSLNFMRLESGYDEGHHIVRLYSDFAKAEITGQFDYATLTQSIANIIGSRLPTLPGLPPIRENGRNNFAVNLKVADTEWLQKIAGINLTLDEPLSVNAIVNDKSRQLNLEADVPQFIYDGKHYSNGRVEITTPSDSMIIDARLTQRNERNEPMTLSLHANAADNKLRTTLQWDNHSAQKRMNGQLDAVTNLYRNLKNEAEARIIIQPSPIFIEGEKWNIEAADMTYSPKRLSVNHFKINNGEQQINVNGIASDKANDIMTVNLNKVDVEYIQNLVNFHAVDFTGLASGAAYVESAFSNPQMHADLTVEQFTFQQGRMGTLSAAVDWNRHLKQIDIHAIADDGPDAKTLIDGYVSPDRSTIDLNIEGKGTHIDFLHSFTKSFLDNVGGHAYGNVRLHGPLSTMQLTGMLVVDGQATVIPLGTTYTLRHDTVRFVTDDILLQNVPIYDKYDNVGIMNGGIHHQHITNLTFDLGVQTGLLLGYDIKDTGNETFHGTVFTAGDVTIQGRPGRVTIDCNVTPLNGSVFTYNVASPDAISNQEFITWRNKNDQTAPNTKESAGLLSSSTDIYLNLNIYAEPDATLRLLMDATTRDYITLNGTGALRATYYNKGAFQMFGTYTVDHGTYGITIQNLIKKNFTFNPGGTIVFGGDPYDAAIQLQAVYPVQGVSLTDLSIGNSFSQNTIRVNCLMNISGQPNQPRVDFDLDMPTVNADEQQMVRSVINGDQEMNQQVLYLLSIGRFYQQGQNNEQSSQDQTSLAMQSLISGTISSQINNVLSSLIKNNDWNFGANISTGTEGWNNAEYEGIINGRMLNNRLLINGQFGYRDNATQATPSFIGDFDIRYLLYPSGNLALKVYNQTNDRYFTRSSLNTQGIGLIMKKDFGHVNELFRKR